MEIKVIGCGSAFSNVNYNQSFLLSENGETLLLDCGFRTPQAFFHHKIDPRSIDNIYISHSHADHIGGLEFMAFSRYDWMKMPRHYEESENSPPTLIANEELMKELWNESLQGGLKSMEGFDAEINTFFKTKPIASNETFRWQGWKCELIQQIHVMTGTMFMNTFGLFLSKEGHKSIYFTTDSQHCSPRQIEIFYRNANIIFQDCECIGIDTKKKEYKFGGMVHASYAQLAGYPSANSIQLPADIKAKMVLSHYQDFVNEKKDFYGNDCDWDKLAKDDGFLEFAKVGKIYKI